MISITSPEADSVIKGILTLTGNVSDDLAIQSVTVTFSSTSQPSLAQKSYPATIDSATGSWSLTIDSTDAVAGLTDSNYEVIATASDTTKKTSSAARSIQLDNTAPTVLITSPSLYGSGENRTKFCSQLEIKGEAYDASKIQYVKVYLCNAQGQVKAGPVEADGTNTWSAMFSPADLAALSDNEVYYFYAVAEDESGNISQNFYHKADLYEILPAGAMFPSMNDIGHLDQGTTPSANCQLTAAALQAERIAAGSDGIIAAVAAATGSGNPDYPDFTYQASAGANVIWTNLDDDDAVINVGSGIFATIQPPTDNSAIKLDSVVIEIQAQGTTTWWTQDIFRQKVGESVNITAAAPEFAVGSGSAALQEGNYTVKLTCETNSHSTITAEKDFAVQSLTEAPILSEGSTEASFSTLSFEQRIVNTADFTKLTGKLFKSNGLPITGINLTENALKIVCTTSSGNNEGTWSLDPYGGTGINKIIYNQTTGVWETKDGVISNVDDTYTFSITGKVGSTPTMITRVLIVDRQEPTVSLVTPADGSCITGTGFSFQGSAMDEVSGVDATYWCIDVATASHGPTDAGFGTPEPLSDNGKPVKGKWYKFRTPTSFNNVTPDLSDTTDYPEQNYKVFVFSVDKAGNTSDVTESEFVLDGYNPELRVHSVSASGITKNANFKLAGAAWDTNGLASLTVSDGTTTWTSVGTGENSKVTLTDKHANPVPEGQESDPAYWNWSIEFGVGNDTELPHISDGSKTFTITLKDVAGKMVTETRSITVDTENPEITAVSAEAVAGIPADKIYLDESASKKLNVSASDSGSGLAGVYYQVTATESAPAFDDASQDAWTPMALGSSSWTANVDFSTVENKTEGNHYIYVAAKDNVGNTTLYATPLQIAVDKQKPVISVTGVTDANASDITLTIVVNDTNPDADELTVEVVKPDSSSLGSLTPVSAGTNTWEVIIPFGEDSYSADGLYKIKVNETDTRGRAADQVIHTIRKDTTAPAVNTIDSPEAGKTGTNALYETTYLFRGTAKDIDGSTDCAGLAKVLYAFTRSSSAPAASAYTEISMSDGSWSVTKTLNSGKTAAATGNLYEGKWYLYVLAEDKAGNRTATPCVREFDIDMGSPVLTVTSPADITQTTYTKNDSFAFSGTAADTNGIQTLTVQIDDDDPVPVSVDSSTDVWSYTLSRTDTNKDKPLSVKFTVTDIAGKTIEKSVPFFFDTQAPSVTITLPAANETTANSTYTLSGTVADTGCGVDTESATYVIKKGTEQVASGALTVTGASWKAENVALGSAEGSLDLTITIKDKLGQETSIDRNFYYDFSNPELREFSVTASGKTTNAGFTLAGTAWDTNELDSITVTDGTTTWTSSGTSPAVTLTKKTADPGTAAADWNWNIAFVTGSSNSTNSKYVADGSTTFTITAKDVAGKTVSTTRTVTVDTVQPSISEASVQNTLVKLDESVYDKLTVTASDSGTGLSCVYYQVLASNSSAPDFTDSTESAWISLALGAAGWTGNADFSTEENKTEGSHYIYVAAMDNAGNRFIYSTPITITVDKQKPVITVTGVTDANDSDITLTIVVNDTNPDADELTVEVVKPDGSSLGNLTPVSAGTNTWEVIVPFGEDSYSADGLYKIKVNETDTRGRAADQVIHSIRKDTIAPAVNTIDSPEAGKTGTDALYGASYLFRGTAKDIDGSTDCAGLGKIFYAFTRSATPPAASAYTEKEQSDGTWSITKNFNEGTSATAGTDNLYEGKWYLYVLAEDKAGNCTATPCVREFDVDMGNPVLSVTSPADSNQTTYTKDDAFVISGTATDTNGVGSLTIQLGNGTAEPVTVNGSGAWTYSFNKADVTNNELLSAKLVLTDVVGKTTEKSVPFFFDTEAPSVTITLPGENETTANSTYTLSGTVADTGSGVDSANATYVIKRGTEQIASGALTVTGASWKAENVALGSAEGSLDLTITIKDKLGQETSIDRNFYYDFSNPELREFSVTASGKTTNAGFTLAGTAWDTNELDSITVSDGTHTWTSSGTSPAVTLTKKTADPGTEETDWNWNIAFVTGSSNSTNSKYVADGTTTFTITAKDVAGKTVSTTRTVTVDTSLPAISEASVQNTLVKLDESVYDKLTVTASDNGTGLQGVYYQVFASSFTTPTFTDATESAWTSLALGVSGWTGNVDFSTDENKTEGDHYIYVAAKDNAGNRFIYLTPITITVDKQKPVITVTGVTDAGASAVTLTIAVNDTNPDASRLTVAVEKPDGSSLGNLTPVSAGSNTWTVSVPFNTGSYSDDGLYKITINETDTRDRAADQVIHSIRKDTIAPAVNTIDSPEAGKTGTDALYGASYLFRGTAKDIDGSTDCAGLAKVLYAFTRSSSAPAASAYTEISMSDGSWVCNKEP